MKNSEVIQDIENFVISQMLNPYWGSVYKRWRGDPKYYQIIKEPQYPGQDLEKVNDKYWLFKLTSLIADDPLLIMVWFKEFPEWKEKVFNRLKLFGPIKFYKWLNCPLINYLKENGVKVAD